jgi:hypothetical protein
MLRSADFTGRGGPDWIVDYSKLRCDAAFNPFCGAGGGCSLDVFLYVGDKWQIGLSENVRSYRIVKGDGGFALWIEMGGSACDRPGSQSCAQTVRFTRNGHRAGSARPERVQRIVEKEAAFRRKLIPLQTKRRQAGAEAANAKRELDAFRARNPGGPEASATLARLESNFREAHRNIERAWFAIKEAHRDFERSREACCAPTPPATKADRDRRARQKAVERERLRRREEERARRREEERRAQ